MASSGISIRGLKEVTRSLSKLGVEAGDLKAAMKKAGQIVADEAKSIVPTRTGRLAASIKPSNAKNSAVVRAGGARIPYAGVIHYGGYNNITAQPFLIEALEHKQGEAVRGIDEDLGALIKKYNLN